MESFIAFVAIVVIWLALGSWGATLLTRKGYFAPESAAMSTRPMYTHRTTSSGVPLQYFVAFLGPVALLAALFVAQEDGGLINA